MKREHIRLLYMGLSRLQRARRTRDLLSETHESLRALLLDIEGGNEDVVDALFSEWDDRIRELVEDEQAERQRKQFKQRHDMEQRHQKRSQQVYLWCRYEGWFSDGPHLSLTVDEGGQVIVNEHGDRIGWWDASASCWRAKKHPEWRIKDPPRISASRKSSWK
jgi:hypothetical protein